MKTCYIMRGLPGSGKSTIARQLMWGDGRIHSTDDLRYCEGQYVFDPKETERLHTQNYLAFCRSIREGIPTVICDNTNIKLWEFERYINYAKSWEYQVVIVTVTADPEICAARNTHGVSLEVIERMAKNWEPY
jgi:predicted kinase